MVGNNQESSEKRQARVKVVLIHSDGYRSELREMDLDMPIESSVALALVVRGGSVEINAV